MEDFFEEDDVAELINNRGTNSHARSSPKTIKHHSASKNQIQQINSSVKQPQIAERNHQII